MFLSDPVGVDFRSDINAEFGYILEVWTSSIVCMMIYILFYIDKLWDTH